MSPRRQAFNPDVLRTARQRRGLSRADLAALLEVSATTVKSWEQNRRTPRPSILLELAHVLQVPLDRLVGEPWPGEGMTLRGLRRTQGWTLTEASRHLGESTRTIRRVEAGEILPPDPRHWARVYGLSDSQLAEAVRGMRI